MDFITFFRVFCLTDDNQKKISEIKWTRKRKIKWTLKMNKLWSFLKPEITNWFDVKAIDLIKFYLFISEIFFNRIYVFLHSFIWLEHFRFLSGLICKVSFFRHVMYLKKKVLFSAEYLKRNTRCRSNSIKNLKMMEWTIESKRNVESWK